MERPTVWQKAKPGDRLWARETWGAIKRYDNIPPRDVPVGSAVGYTTDGIEHWCQTGCEGAAGKWRPSIHMPRWASRLTLVVMDVRLQHLQELTDEDALAEGIVPHENGGFHVPGIAHPIKAFPYLSRTTPREMFAALFDTVRGSGAWLANPQVIVLTFNVHRCNIDERQ